MTYQIDLGRSVDLVEEAEHSSRPLENKGWTYSAGRQAAIVIYCSSEHRKLNVLSVIALEVDPDQEKVNSLVVLAADEAEILDEFDYNEQPYRLYQNLKMAVRDSDDEKISRDSSRVKKRLEDYFNSSLTLRSIAHDLRENEVETVEEQVREFVKNSLLGAADCEVKLRVSPWRRPEVAEYTERQEEKNNQEEARKPNGVVGQIEANAAHLLAVETCIDPLAGQELNDLRLGDEILVRVVGESLESLNSSLIDEEVSEDYLVSRPIPAELAALKLGDKRGEIQFWAKFKERVYGRGVQPDQARVKLHRSAAEDNETLATMVQYLATFMIILSLAIFLLLIGVPELFFALVF